MARQPVALASHTNSRVKLFKNLHKPIFDSDLRPQVRFCPQVLARSLHRLQSQSDSKSFGSKTTSSSFTKFTMKTKRIQFFVQGPEWQKRLDLHGL